MTLAEIQAALAAVERAAGEGDDEVAHANEDSLREAVLLGIVDGSLTGDEAVEAARLALSSDALNFSRWYA